MDSDSSKDLALRGNYLPQSVDQLKQQKERVQDVMRALMKEDVHYGVIPGTNKPSLLKPGADMLLSTFQIGVFFKVEDLGSAGEYRYRVTCKGVHLGTNILIGEGLGECSSNEEKYRWRECGQREYQGTHENLRRIKYGGYYAKGGQYMETEKYQVRNNPADKANTVLKMAKKRAQVDLCLTALAASDIFAQGGGGDPADSPRQQEPVNHGYNRPNPVKPDKQPNTQPEGKITTGQIGLIRARLGVVSEDDLVLRFRVGCIEDIDKKDVNTVLEWIGEQNKRAME